MGTTRTVGATERILGSAGVRLERALTSNSTSTAFSTVVGNASLPTDEGVRDRGNATHLFVIPFGRDAGNEDFHLRVNLWYTDEDANLWIPSPQDFACTLGTTVGVSGNSLLTNSDFLCDTITSVNAPAAPLTTIYSPTNNLVGYIRIDMHGCSKYSFEFDRDAGGSTAAQANALIGTL